MESITIRELNDVDIDELKKIYFETIQNEFPEYTQNTRNYFTDKEYTDVMLKHPIKIGAFNNKKILGYLIARNTFGGILFVSWLAVLKDFQRKGIGKKLMEYIEKIAVEQGAHGIHLEAIGKVVPFYKSLGYEEYGFDKNSYFGIDVFLLKKLLHNPDEKEYLKEYLLKK